VVYVQIPSNLSFELWNGFSTVAATFFKIIYFLSLLSAFWFYNCLFYSVIWELLLISSFRSTAVSAAHRLTSGGHKKGVKVCSKFKFLYHMLSIPNKINISSVTENRCLIYYEFEFGDDKSDRWILNWCWYQYLFVVIWRKKFSNCLYFFYKHRF
jgi:hypothetical protein